MTVRINFLPRTYQPPRQMGTREWVAVGALVAGLAAAGSFYALGFAATGRMEQQVAVDQVELQAVRAQLTEAADLRSREERVASAEAELKALSGQRWSGVLLNLRDLTPRYVTWTGLKAEGEQITLTAVATGLTDVAQLLGGLANHPDVDEAALRFVSEKGLPIILTSRTVTDEQVSEILEEVGTYRQLEFELVITLVKPEGRQIPRGA